MSHEVESAFYVAKPAWHSLGTVLQNSPSTRDGIIHAGLNWPVLQSPVEYRRQLVSQVVTGHLSADPIPDAEFEPAANLACGMLGVPAYQMEESRRVNYRGTDGQFLGIVGTEFVPLQNVDAFAWFDPLIDAGLVSLEAAGSLRQGQRIWILARINDCRFEVVPGDAIEAFVLLAHGHDGKFAIRAGITRQRVECANMLASAVTQDAATLFKIRHRGDVLVSLAAARELFDLERRKLRADADVFGAMARYKLTDAQAANFWREVLHEGAGTDPEIKVRNIPELMGLYEAGRGAHLGRGTLWGAFNAMTEYLTHNRLRTDDARVDSAWFGTTKNSTNHLLGRTLTLANTLVGKAA